LRIATLPPGEDPDDLVKRGGAAAFEAVLAAAIPLSDYLWRSETEGSDVATPERRAALRQRLKAHSDAIADPSVRSLYAADFTARFEAQFLSRPERPRQPFQRGGKYMPPLAGASAALRSRAAGASAELGAILVGLLTHPTLADRHGETLAALPIADPGQARLRDATLSALALAPDLEMAALRHDLASRGLDALVERTIRGNRLRFSFTRPETPFEIADRDFGLLVETIAARARVESELAAATARLRSSFESGDYERQQALLAERVELDSAMMRLAESLRGD
jgi:DNA primase